MKKNIFIAGGAGYIGSHLNLAAHERGYGTVVYDNLVYGHKSAVQWGDFVLGDLEDIKQLRLVFRHFRPDAVMHFAAYACVGESVAEPEKYYLNNVAATLNLLRVMREAGCRDFIFSSTCATYGIPRQTPITEDHPQVPVNPYGRSKLMVENMLADYAAAYGMRHVNLRYFNAAGADRRSRIGEDHQPETHLIPLVLDAAAGKKPGVSVFGTDYDTPDGTCVRDYIHVEDLAQAHLLALEYLFDGGESISLNLGNGQGYSVKEVIDCARAVTGREIRVTEGPRRAGDPPALVGGTELAARVLGWRPALPRLEDIIGTAWAWHKKRFGHESGN
ncbi:MAG: UDP-glucose 4-epimerase GalE [Desulfovibrio sp.]|jgi:UDP-glucose 4-epimerase|nr:UDP-glucose 4-epimerase GalE [Desulfovibrio sp.]